MADSRPPVGSLLHLEEFLHDSVGGMTALYQQYGDCVAFMKGQNSLLFAFGPAYNRLLLGQPDVFYLISGMPGPRNSAQRQFSTGLFGLNGEQHQERRRLLMPPFRKEAVESYCRRLVEVTGDHLGSWREGQVRDIATESRDLALRITSEVLFGLDDLALAHAVGTTFEEWVDLNHTAFFAAMLPVSASPECYEGLLSAAETLRGRLLALLEHKRSRPPDASDVLSLLMQAQAAGKLTEAELLGHTHTLFNAAFHTTTYALTWALFLLAQHPTVASQVLEELDENLATSEPTVEGLAALPQLDRLLKESMRVLPPVAYYPRISARATTLGSYPLASGTVVIGSHYVTHHLSELYALPERFLPERWMCLPPRPSAYLPFGMGARMCIGAPFAVLMLKVALAMIWQRFRLTVVPGTQIDRHATLTLGPRKDIPAMLWRQDGRFSTSAVLGNVHEMVALPTAGKVAVAA